MKINERSLELSDSDFDNIIDNILKGNNTLDSLEIELLKNGLSLEDFSDIQLNGYQLRHKLYRDLYSEIVCVFWNRKIAK